MRAEDRILRTALLNLATRLRKAPAVVEAEAREKSPSAVFPYAFGALGALAELAGDDLAWIVAQHEWLGEDEEDECAVEERAEHDLGVLWAARGRAP